MSLHSSINTFDGSTHETQYSDDSDDEDVVTIAGICRYCEYSTSYPCLDNCDYFYVNDDE